MMIHKHKDAKTLNDVAKKVKTITLYISRQNNPTYNDFLYFADITSQDFNLLYQHLMIQNEKAKKIYYALEKIKTKFELDMEKLLRYQNHKKGNFNYKLLKELYDKSINSPISVHFKSIEIVGDTFISIEQKQSPNLSVIPANESGVDIFDMRKKVNNND